jgi:prepilin-type N-terminal cleavage/methylation domain-containing protein
LRRRFDNQVIPHLFLGSNLVSRPRVRPRSGFTLVELLVVIGIIGVLMGLLLPAVQAARESGRRATCSNNQYQLAFAAIHYNDTNGFLPGWRNRLSSTMFPSWPVMTLPFIERKDIYAVWLTGTVATPSVSMFVCPSSPPPAGVAAPLAYAGNCGTGASSKWDGVMHDVSGATSATRVPISLGEIAERDGSTNTVFLSEKCGRNATNVSDPPHAWDVRPSVTMSFTFALGATAVPGFGIAGATAPSKIINSGTASTLPGFWSQPSSNHPGGAVFACCDGRTIFLKDSLAAKVYANLLNPDNANATSTWGGLTRTDLLSEGDFQ